MNSKLQKISITSFVLLMLSMLVSLSVSAPIEFDIMGKLLLFVIVGSMLGTIVPLIIVKSNE